jgi:hypothetical protein
MKSLLLLAVATATLLTAAASAQDRPAPTQRKDCAELRSEIAAKLDAKGVRHYRLEVVAPEALGEARQVGSCDGGTRRIAYQRLSAGEAAAATAAAATVAPLARPEPGTIKALAASEAR